MRIKYINQDGGGFSGHIDVRDGLTAGQLFVDKFPGQHPNDYKIRVNRVEATADQVLKEGDTVAITPAKQKGNCVV